MTVARTPALGGTRDVPVPDPVARDYLLLGLRLDQHLPGTVDGYFGPADLKAQVDLEPTVPPARLADAAAALRERLPTEVADPARRHWLDLQLVALETLAAERAGRELPYLDTVARCFARRPERRPDARFDAAAAALESLLPGRGSLLERLEAEDAAWTVAPDRVRAVVDIVLARFRDRAARWFGLPEGERLQVSLVRAQPWTGYNWYDGGYRSRVDLNLDLPVRLPALIGAIAHETYPGHHLEHATKEQVLVEGKQHLEASMLLINAPECLVSEGLAQAGRLLMVPPGSLPDLLAELAPIAGLPMADEAPTLAEAAGRAPAIAAERATLDESRVNAAILRHQEGRSHDQVLDYLVETGRFAPDVAAKRLEFIEHPRWRLYVHVYPEGEALVTRWLGTGTQDERASRFARLLREPLTPPALAAELGDQSQAAGRSTAVSERG
jgi:hypothetical protein